MEFNFENKRVIIDDDLTLHIEIYTQVIIKPHRDKKVVGNKAITSLSVDATRLMLFERNGIIHNIELTNGSLCVIYPPTNDKWLHSIVSENIERRPRISLKCVK